MAHTPGPWRARAYRTGPAPQHGNAQPNSIWIDCIAATKSGTLLGGTIGEVYANGTGGDDPSVQLSNAALIAAAPELLAALKGLMQFDSAAYNKGSARARALIEAKKVAWAALAKAGAAP